MGQLDQRFTQALPEVQAKSKIDYSLAVRSVLQRHYSKSFQGFLIPLHESFMNNQLNMLDIIIDMLILNLPLNKTHNVSVKFILRISLL